MEKIKKLKKLFKQFNLDGYIVPKNNNFFGEYISPSEDNLKYISDLQDQLVLWSFLKTKIIYSLTADTPRKQIYKVEKIIKFVLFQRITHLMFLIIKN